MNKDIRIVLDVLDMDKLFYNFDKEDHTIDYSKINQRAQ